MGIIPLTIATLCYVWAAFTFAMERNWWMCLIYAAYGVANVGLIALAYKAA